jgi:hypothetical protein
MPDMTTQRRRTRRSREKRYKAEPMAPVPAQFSTLHDDPAADPVRIALLAMETLGPASMRASFSGIEVCVAAPDDSIAAIFRAVLAETGRRRSTDRLIRVVVEY